ncbi:MT-A70-domain-containing protein [Suillus clintonianus]|uniref:MT-A70-domain-containing protein n=1 Tax=Suillus clintonianus TaxID=1904413 RepID=UPI001B871A6A|nr:MT-A70-domain-containing protein [Suillus clintonianus]KAG2123422.1 MT-A70-domain-containing protein [Suillus clintonianus]
MTDIGSIPTAIASTTDVLNSANSLLTSHRELLTYVRNSQRAHRRQLRALATAPSDLVNFPLIDSPGPSPLPSPPSSPQLAPRTRPQRQDLHPAKRARVARYANYVPEEETIRNDYSQRYVDSGEWPQNRVLGAEPSRRFEEYPKQQRLLSLKKESVDAHSTPPFFLPFSHLSSLHPQKFDVILLDPPFSSSFSWDDLQALPVPSLAADPSFVFMWVGSGAGEGLERGREVLAKWGYRRCEDVVWVKTNNTTNRGPGTDPPTTSLLTRTKQHCLMGIRGTVRRSTDSWFVHCNVDTDVIIWEGDTADPMRKPPEMYTLIENFCLGTRRLELFGRARSSLRRGWVTVLTESDGAKVGEHARTTEGDAVHQWNKDSWDEATRHLASLAGGKCVVPNSQEIDALRPKSPMRSGNSGVSGGVGVAISGGVGVGSAGVGMNAGNMNTDPNMNMQLGRRQPSQNQMMVSPMMGMGIPMDMGMGMGNMMGMGMGNMGMMGMGNMGVMGMGDMPGTAFQWVGDGDRMWEDGMMAGMGMGGGMGMGNTGMGVGGPGMGMGMGMGNSRMGMGGMGMHGQWGQGYDGFQ